MKIPTDLQILEKIYNKYYHKFESFEEGKSDRNTKIYVPIDVNQIGDELGVDGDIVFGRLYYHLNHKFSYKNKDESEVNFFALRLGSEKVDVHSVHFPYLASVLADLKYENN